MQNAKPPGSLGMVGPLWHHLSPDQDHAAGELYQTSLMSALMNGVYEGAVTYGELRKHGDFGLGTFNGLDGEMVGFDGTFYQLRSDGSARPVTPDQQTPFAVVTFFRPELEIDISATLGKQEVQKLIEDETDANLFIALRIDGVFEEVRTRTADRQNRPYRPLTEALAHQAVNSFSEVQGTLAGFRSPAYAQGIGIAGFHLHFLREDKLAGGHALDYRLRSGKIQAETLHGFHVELPSSNDFLKSDLQGTALDNQIKAVEG